MSAEAAAPSGSGVPERRWPRRVAYGMAGLAVLLPSGTAGAGWYFAAQVLTPARDYPVQIRAIDGDEITLTRTEDTERHIPLGLVWERGHARLGAIVRQDRTTVVRKLVAVTHGTLRVGSRAYTSSFVYDGDPHTVHGLEYAEVRVPGELGELPAWLVPGADPATWVIAVHGRGAHRGEALRVLPTLVASGATTLVITYRNDVGAPASRDGCYHLGADEWRDLTAAVSYVRSRGAARIVLYGWSMGGAIVLNALRRRSADGVGPATGLDGVDGAGPGGVGPGGVVGAGPGGVVGVVLDCPVVDWAATLRLQAGQRRMPAPLTWSAMRLVEQRIGVRLSTLDFRAYAMPVPTLVFLDDADHYVAQGPTREFAAANADSVRLVETTGGGHVRSWNVDRELYESELAGFIKSL